MGTYVSAPHSGSYPIEHRAGEIDRLNIQSKAMAPDTRVMLARFGSMQGWACLDIGCGPGGITNLLSDCVGPAGRVIGLDMNAEFLEYARANVPTPLKHAEIVTSNEIRRLRYLNKLGKICFILTNLLRVYSKHTCNQHAIMQNVEFQSGWINDLDSISKRS